MKDMISVIVPIFNSEKYLCTCVESILSQTYQDIEILLIDDGSTDSSGKLCDRLSEKDRRVRVFHRENAGVSASRNFGIEHSLGKYILFLDSDDFMSHDAIEILHKNLCTYQGDISIGKVVDTYDAGYEFLKANEEVSVWDNKTTIKNMLETKGTSFFPVAKLFKKELITGILFDSKYKLAEDALFLTTMYLSKEIKTVYTEKEVYAYFHHSDSATTTVVKDSVFDTIKAHRKIFDMVIATYPDLEESLMERRYWSYFTVYDKIITASNQDFAVESKRLKKKIKKGFIYIMRSKGFRVSRKIAVCFLMISESLYKKCIQQRNKGL